MAPASSNPLITLLAALVGAGIASFAAWLNTRRTVTSDRQLAQVARDETQRQALTDRTTAFLAASYHGVLSLRDLALAEPAEKHRLEKAEVWPTVDRVNTALLAVQINDPPDVVRAAEAIDAAMVVLAREARESFFSHEEWRARRKQLMGTLLQEAVAAARAHALQLQQGGS